MSGHRPRRETASNAKELDAVQKENGKLKKEVAKLQKYVAKLLSRQAATLPDEEEQVEHLQTDGVQCPDCNKPLSVVNLGVKSLRVCKACGWRKVA